MKTIIIDGIEYELVPVKKPEVSILDAYLITENKQDDSGIQDAVAVETTKKSVVSEEKIKPGKRLPAGDLIDFGSISSKAGYDAFYGPGLEQDII